MTLARPRLGLPREARLHRPEEFRLALRSRRRRRGRWFTLMLVITTDQPNRLGLVVARRVIPSAVERNRLKRLAREAFRAAAPALVAADRVFQVHAAPPRNTPTAALHEELLALLEWSST